MALGFNGVDPSRELTVLCLEGMDRGKYGVSGSCSATMWRQAALRHGSAGRWAGLGIGISGGGGIGLDSCV